MRVDVTSDARFSDIGPLPSACKPYSFKSLLIRPLSVEELKLISQAVTLKDISYLIRAVDLVVNQPVAELTIGDFFYILMWLRVKSYPKSPVVVSWNCNAEYYVEVESEAEKIANELSEKAASEENTTAPKEVTQITPDGRPIFKHDDTVNPEESKFPPRKKTRKIYKGKPDDIDEMLKAKLIEKLQCDNSNTEIVRLSNIEILCLDDDFTELDEGLDFPRVKLLAEVMANENNTEYAFILPAAQWIKYGDTLKDKLEYLEKQPDLNLFDAAFAASDEIVHGVKENVRLTCSRCGTSHYHALEVNPLTFFRR